MEEREAKVSFIPCLSWVRRGVAQGTLTKANPTKEELQEIMKEMKLREAEFKSRPKPEAAEHSSSEEDDEDADAAVDDFYDMDNYDDEEGVSAPGVTTDLNALLGQSGAEDSPDSDEEPDEFTIKPNDNLILCGHVDGNVCLLEVYVFNNDVGDLFVLNDMFLPTYPICVEWLDFNPKAPEGKSNLAAVGYVTPELQIWDLSIRGNLEPLVRLGSKKKKGMRHQDAVLDLSWHSENRTVLASGSADKSVILWDLTKSDGIVRIDSFEEKVQSLAWHPFEVQSLLTGAADGKVRLYDCRNPKYFKTWGFEGEIERVMWNQFDPFYYFATSDQGMVHYVDTRNSSKPVWNLKAHEKEVTGICLSSHCKDLLITGSMDESVKVWDLKDGTPSFVSQKNMAIGGVYVLGSNPDVPYVFCGGGSKKDSHLYVWDARENEQVMERFKGRQFEEATVVEATPSTSASSSKTSNDGRIPLSKQSVKTETKSKKKKKKKSKKSKSGQGPSSSS